MYKPETYKLESNWIVQNTCLDPYHIKVWKLWRNNELKNIFERGQFGSVKKKRNLEKGKNVDVF